MKSIRHAVVTLPLLVCEALLVPAHHANQMFGVIINPAVSSPPRLPGEAPILKPQEGPPTC